jgi:hypothetical protein
MATATEIKERPILFSGPMVCAILAGMKTQTRRVVKFSNAGCWERGSLPDSWVDQSNPIGTYPTYVNCPYGQPGDRLWVRETFLLRESGKHAVYKAGMDSVEAAGFGAMYGGWKPSIFMPRWASRLSLKVTGVRVERVQDISEADAIAEGRCLVLGDERGYFPETWDTINAKRGFGWDANPWVWVIEFKRVAEAEG